MFDTQIVWYLFVSLIIFLTFVLPLWMIFHYVTKWKAMKQESQGSDRMRVDAEEMKRLHDTAHTLELRIASLEKILDAQAPGWRNS